MLAFQLPLIEQVQEQRCSKNMQHHVKVKKSNTGNGCVQGYSGGHVRRYEGILDWPSKEVVRSLYQQRSWFISVATSLETFVNSVMFQSTDFFHDSCPVQSHSELKHLITVPYTENRWFCTFFLHGKHFIKSCVTVLFWCKITDIFFFTCTDFGWSLFAVHTGTVNPTSTKCC